MLLVGVTLFADAREAGPCLSIFDVRELLRDFFLADTGSLCLLPEVEELFFGNITITVDIDLIEKFLRRQLAEFALPVVQSLRLINLLACVLIEDPEDGNNLCLHFLAQLLWE